MRLDFVGYVAIGLFRAGFPFVDGSAAAFGADEVLGSDLLGEHAVFAVLVREIHGNASLTLKEGYGNQGSATGLLDQCVKCSNS
jgi:hypothetical protein